jgi:hypothetical protein
MESPEQWVTAAAAIALLKPIMASYAAQTTICTRAYNGLIRARAQRYMQGNRGRDDSEVPSEFWWAKGEAALTQNWAIGDFETWIDHTLHLRAFGVSFLRADIEKMLPETPPETSVAASPSVVPVETAAVVRPHIVPYELLRGRRQYLENLAGQINGCYQFGYYDGCAVMSRRLLECLLILAFEKCGYSTILRDASDTYKPLSELISLTSSGQYINRAHAVAAFHDPCED